MVEDTETQVGASMRTKGGRKGKTTQVQAGNGTTNENKLEVTNNKADKEADSNSDFNDGNKRYNFHTLSKLVLKLMSCSYYSWSTHIKSFLWSVPHAMKHLEGVYDKKHPK